MEKNTDWRTESRTVYSNDFKLRIVQLASQPDANVAKIARDSGVDHNLIMEKADLSLKSEETSRKALLMSKKSECKDEVLRLMELFEEQHSESPGFLYDEIPYMITLSAIVMHRAGCELHGEPEKYNISEQLDFLELTPAIRSEIEFFLIKNRWINLKPIQFLIRSRGLTLSGMKTHAKRELRRNPRFSTMLPFWCYATSKEPCFIHGI